MWRYVKASLVFSGKYGTFKNLLTSPYSGGMKTIYLYNLEKAKVEEKFVSSSCYAKLHFSNLKLCNNLQISHKFTLLTPKKQIKTTAGII